MPSIVFVHGSWSDDWYLQRYVDAARERGFEAWSVDVSGFGRPSVDDLAAEVRRALADLGGEPVLAGHSFGGLVALRAAAAGGVRALVLLASVSPRGAIDVPLGIQLAMARYAPAILLGRDFEMDPELGKRLFYDEVPEDVADFAWARAKPGHGRAMREAMLGRARVEPDAIRCPVLVVGAARDRYAPPRVQRRLAERLGADYLEAEGLGHMLMLGPGWERHAQAVLDWVGTTAAAAPEPA